MVSQIDNMSEGGLRGNFWWMSACFALNHGTVTTPLVVATTLLDKNAALAGNAALYVATLLASLLLSAPASGVLGPKRAMMMGMLLYCIYVGCFALSAFTKGTVALTWLFFLPGSICGGVAAGILWTAQGGYFGQTATLLAQASGQPRDAVSADLAGKFAYVYLGFEVASKLCFSALQKLHVPAGVVGFIFFVLGALALLGMSAVATVSSSGARVNPIDKVTAALKLWKDPVIWLLSPTNLTFGFCAAFMNGYVNKYYAGKELGDNVVALMAALTSATAAVLSWLYGPLASKVGKGPVILLGAACFLCIPGCLFVLGCCNHWGWWLIVLYFLQGSGRAVYESTNRATFSDFFTGSDTEAAFANCMLQSALAFALCFFLQASLDGKALAVIVALLSMLTPLFYWLARRLQARRQRKDEATAALADAASPELGG